LIDTFLGEIDPNEPKAIKMRFEAYYSILLEIMEEQITTVRSKQYTKSESDNLQTVFQINASEFPVIPNFVFVLMSFTKSWSNCIWLDYIKKTVEDLPDLNLLLQRADDLHGFDIMHDIVKSIIRSRLL
jgi:hypothetical protein